MLLVVAQSLSCVQLFATTWTTACQAFLSFTFSWNLLIFLSIEAVMLSNHLILCQPILLFPSVFPSIRILFNESTLCIRWPKYWSSSFSISPFNEYLGLISIRIDWFDLLAVQEHYCIGTWNIRSMNQGKLEVVKQEMARVNIYILGIGELKQTGMGEFNSDDHYIYYSGQESLRRNGVAIIVNKRVQNHSISQ